MWKCTFANKTKKTPTSYTPSSTTKLPPLCKALNSITHYSTYLNNFSIIKTHLNVIIWWLLSKTALLIPSRPSAVYSIDLYISFICFYYKELFIFHFNRQKKKKNLHFSSLRVQPNTILKWIARFLYIISINQYIKSIFLLIFFYLFFLFSWIDLFWFSHLLY